MEERSVRHARGCFDVGACFYWDCVCITEDDEGFCGKVRGFGRWDVCSLVAKKDQSMNCMYEAGSCIVQ